MKQILTRSEIQAKAVNFAEQYKGIKYERQEAQTFYNDFFKVFGIVRQGTAIFERHVKKLKKGTEKLEKRGGFIDLFWPNVLLAEHKSAGEDLTKAKEQAEDYLLELKNDERPKCLLVCDFQNFLLIDLDENEEFKFKLKDLPEKTELFDFMRGIKKRDFTSSDPVSIKAAEMMAGVYKKLKDNGYPEDEIDYFLTRLTFCLFADDTGIFEPRGILDDYLEESYKDGSGFGAKIEGLFYVLNRVDELRQEHTSKELKQFPYINGNLFNKKYTTAEFNKEMRAEILKASKFDWSKVSPAIFGSLFQGVMEKKKRREEGAHYTTEENIMKVIRPLFLDELTNEFEQINNRKTGDRKLKLKAFQNKLGNITFFDPACGSGNFLIIAYREIRRLELKVILQLEDENTQRLDVSGLSKINVTNFYGIEKEEFSAKIAEVSLWMMDHIMNRELGFKFGLAYAELPLKASPTIKNKDALDIDWNEIIPSNKCSYILGNPPYKGKKEMTDEQRAQIKKLYGSEDGRRLDYVTGWFMKASKYICETTRTGFVATNSIAQGEQVGKLWSMLYKQDIDIIFAHESFKWGSEVKNKAQVTVVIIGFAKNHTKIKKRLFYYENNISLEDSPKYISPYIFGSEKPFPIVFESATPLHKLPRSHTGTLPVDGGNYIFKNISDKNDFLQKEPTVKQYIKEFIGGDELINNKKRWIINIPEIPPPELEKMPNVIKRVNAVKQFRLKSKTKEIRDLSSLPTKFHYLKIPTSEFLLIPQTSSEKYHYVPMGFLCPPIIPNYTGIIIENASLELFGLLTSKMHLVWLDKIGGKLESRYRYSGKLVYNTFPTPNTKLDSLKTYSKNILTIRKKYNLPLKKIYKNLQLFPDLQTAHLQLDNKVEKLYRKIPFSSNRERLEFLFKRYQDMIVSGESGPKIGGLD